MVTNTDQMYPNITIQSYVVNGEFKRAGIVNTEPFYRLIRKWQQLKEPMSFGSTWWINETYNAVFMAVHFRHLIDKKIGLKLYGVSYE